MHNCMYRSQFSTVTLYWWYGCGFLDVQQNTWEQLVVINVAMRTDACACCQEKMQKILAEVLQQQQARPLR